MTRLAIRPAKSSWKKARPWRDTCQCACQRTSAVTAGLMACWVARFCRRIASGRPISSTAAIAANIPDASAQSRSRGRSERVATTLPMNSGIIASSSATSSPAANSRANRPRACRMKCQ